MQLKVTHEKGKDDRQVDRKEINQSRPDNTRPEWSRLLFWKRGNLLDDAHPVGLAVSQVARQIASHLAKSAIYHISLVSGW